MCCFHKEWAPSRKIDLATAPPASWFRDRIAYYLEHHLEGRDTRSLDDLRDRCAGVLMETMAVPGLEHASARRAMAMKLDCRPTLDPDQVMALRAGEPVEISGSVVTIRDASARRLVENSRTDLSTARRLLDGVLLYAVGPSPAKPGQGAHVRVYRGAAQILEVIVV